METEESSGAPRGLLIGLTLIMLVVGGAIAAEFILQIQPCLGCGSNTAAVGTVIMPAGVGSNTQLNYAPDTITLIIGSNNTVTFVNKDSAVHTVTATDKSFDSGDIAPGASWTHTFSTPGTFTYYCIYHSWMKGTIVVETSSNSTAGGVTVSIPSGTGKNPALNYSPASFTVVIGKNNTVTFVNNDSAKHTVTADNKAFDSGDIAPGASWTYTFTTPGTYAYHCIYHSWMKGTITVVAG